ncbi:hypothetical protein SDJN02_15610, partial [Cucurbita argyrosperma subsp. argyrosperma]
MQLRVRKVPKRSLWHAKPLKYDITLHSFWYNIVFQIKIFRNPDFRSATSASGCETSGFKSYCPLPRRRRKPFSRTTMEVITRSLGHHQPHPSKAINVFTHWVHPDQLKRDPHSRTVSLRSESDTQAYMISNMAPQHEASYEEQGQCGMGDD